MILKVPDSDISIMTSNYDITSVISILKDNDIDMTKKLIYTEQFIIQDEGIIGDSIESIEEIVSGKSSIEYSYTKVSNYIYEVKIEGYIIDILSLCNLFSMVNRQTLRGTILNELKLINDIVNSRMISADFNSSLILRYLDKENMFGNLSHTVDMLLAISHPQYHDKLLDLLNLCVGNIYGCGVTELGNLIQDIDGNGRLHSLSFSNIDDDLIRRIEEFVGDKVNDI